MFPLKNNCNHFSNALTHEILGHGIPGRVNRLAGMGGACGGCCEQVMHSLNLAEPGAGRASIMGEEQAEVYRPGAVTTQPGAAFSGEGMSLLAGGTTSSSSRPNDAVAMRAARLARFEKAAGGGGDKKAD